MILPHSCDMFWQQGALPNDHQSDCTNHLRIRFLFPAIPTSSSRRPIRPQGATMIRSLVSIARSRISEVRVATSQAKFIV